MSLLSAIAIYFIIWWLCLFAVLPWGVKNAHEVGADVGEGHEAGAPVNPMLWRKALATTVLATVVFAVVYVFITRG
jgi:predicted secreted protein